MRAPNPDLEKKIKNECLKLLLKKEPEQIGMRDIALACGVSPTSIYYYYQDKDSLFEAIKLDCLAEMDRYIGDKTAGCTDSVSCLRQALSSFRDWAFENPRIAVMIMGRLKANLDPASAEFERYYRSSNYGKELLDRAVAEGKAVSSDTLIDSALYIAAVWGAVEAVILNRTSPEFWDKGLYFTDRMIDLCCSSMLGER
jgi:AcrR family transcriptional regulator